MSLAEKNSDEIELPEEGYSRINQQMDDLADEISLLRHTVLALLGGGKNKSEFKPRKRPTSAIQRELKNRIWEAERADNQNLFGKFGF